MQLLQEKHSLWKRVVVGVAYTQWMRMKKHASRSLAHHIHLGHSRVCPLARQGAKILLPSARQLEERLKVSQSLRQAGKQSVRQSVRQSVGQAGRQTGRQKHTVWLFFSVTNYDYTPGVDIVGGVSPPQPNPTPPLPPR